MRQFSICALLLSSALAACSAHPLVEDFSRKTTVQIAKSIRCEAAMGLKKYRDRHHLEPPPSSIGFDFSFDITENDKAMSGQLDFQNPFAGGKFSLLLKGSADKKRQSTRAFRALLTFEDLKKDVDPVTGTCLGHVVEPNLVYPISGNIGMDEVIESYLELNTTLGPRDESADIKKPVKVFSDILDFWTTLNAGIVPTLELGAGGGNFKLRKATIDGQIERIDKHKVTIAISTCKSPSCQILPSMRATNAPDRRVFATRAAPDTDDGTNNVIDELDRIRNRDDDRRIIENLLLTE